MIACGQWLEKQAFNGFQLASPTLVERLSLKFCASASPCLLCIIIHFKPLK